MNIAQIMIPKVCTIFLHQDNTIRQGLEIMLRHGYTAVPVLDQGDKYVGCVTEGDFLRHIIDVGATEMRAQEKYTLKTILRQDFCPPLPITAESTVVINAILEQNFVPIVDDRQALCGIITRRCVISYFSDTAGLGAAKPR